MSMTHLKQFTGMMSRAVLGLSLWLVSAAASAEYGLNFQKPVTSVGQRVLELHNIILLICVVIFVIVFCFMFYSIYAHRKSKGHKAAKFHDNARLEVVWTVIPFVILVAMAIPSTATLLEMDDTSKSDMTVKITGYQWKWQYDYPDQDVRFFSSLSTPREQIENKAAKGRDYLLEVDNPMVLPVGKKVRFLVTANDVIHAWWVPQLALKKDAIPGFINEVWTRVDEPGTYRGQCAELCGKDHGFMPIVVQAVSDDEFKKWVSVKKAEMVASAADAGKAWTKADLMVRGEKVYLAWNASSSETVCVACMRSGRHVSIARDWGAAGAVSDAARAIAVEVRANFPRATFESYVPEQLFDETRRVALVPALRSQKFNAFRGAHTTVSRGTLAERIRSKIKGRSLLTVAKDAPLTLAALAQGYKFSIKDGARLSPEPEPGISRLIGEAIESLIFILDRGMMDAEPEGANFAYNPQGARYRTALPQRRTT